MTVPPSLRRWFVVHFVADMLFAIPLLLAPGAVLNLFGWTCVDPVATRLVGAALVAIGGQSLIGRDDEVAAFRSMLNLKILWSLSAIGALVVGLIAGAPPVVWGLLAIFMAFSSLWIAYRIRLRHAVGRRVP
jgi:hypothetical protein